MLSVDNLFSSQVCLLQLVSEVIVHGMSLDPAQIKFGEEVKKNAS